MYVLMPIFVPWISRTGYNTAPELYHTVGDAPGSFLFFFVGLEGAFRPLKILIMEMTHNNQKSPLILKKCHFKGNWFPIFGMLGLGTNFNRKFTLIENFKNNIFPVLPYAFNLVNNDLTNDRLITAFRRSTILI